MTLISVLLSLLLDRGLRFHRDSPIQSWYGTVTEWIATRLPGTGGGMAALLLVVAVPVVVIGILQYLLAGWLFGLASLVFAILVLLFALGPLDVAEYADGYIKADTAGDRERTAWYRDQLVANDGEEPAHALLYQVHDHLFATLFWFCILGPLGAVFYRGVAETALQPGAAVLSRPGLHLAARRALGVLGWIPARLLVLGFAMTGSFDSAMRALRSDKTEIPDLLDANRHMLQVTGGAALTSDESVETEGKLMEQARGLAIRATVFWLAVLALLTLAGWLS